MSYMKDVIQLCLERDAKRCRHCGTTDDLDVHQLVSRDGRLAWQLSNLVTLCAGCRSEAVDNIAERCDSNRVGVMLCGGRGTRMYPLTKFQNKHTLPIGLIPMIFYPLKTLRALGVYRVLVVIDRDAADQIIPMLGSGKEFGLDISYKVQEGAGGISEALYLARNFVDEDTEEIVVILGDNVFDNSALDTSVDLTVLDENCRTKNEACVFLKPVNNPEDYGIAILNEDGQVTKIVEKPKDHVGNMAVLGLYIYKTSVFGVIEGVDPSERGELEISSVNDHYASMGKLDSRVVNGYWGDAGGSIQRYAECSMHGAKEANVSAEEIDNFKTVVFDDK